MSRILAGPWAAQTLGDLGAEVIKIERPLRGDDTRSWGPPFLKDGDGKDTAETAYYLCANRNKKSVTIDIAREEGQDLVRALVRKSDVFIENFKVGDLKGYGLDFASLQAVNPRLIYCSITGFGQTGPYASRPGYDLLIQAMGGLMSITGRGQGETGDGPQKVGVAVTDIITGLYSAVGVLAALAHREKTGRGQHIDMALLDSQVASLGNQNMNFLTTGVSPRRLGNAHPNIVPYQDLPTKDGALIVAVGNDAQFASFCRALGRADWAQDPRFASNGARVAHRDELTPLLEKATKERNTSDWISALEAAGVPCGRVNTIAEVFADPQVQARKLRIDMPHPLAGSTPSVRNPIRLSESPISYRLSPPTLGEHTDEVLTSLLGLASGEFESLRAQGIV